MAALASSLIRQKRELKEQSNVRPGPVRRKPSPRGKTSPCKRQFLIFIRKVRLCSGTRAQLDRGTGRWPAEGHRRAPLLPVRLLPAAVARRLAGWHRGRDECVCPFQFDPCRAQSCGHSGSEDGPLHRHELQWIPLHIGILHPRVQVQGVCVRELLRHLLLGAVPATGLRALLVPWDQQRWPGHEGEPCEEDQAGCPLPAQTC
ncbi:uncharacterized protein [Narcine bancroftii]|uniref:uncharacterized protein isoform X3 n=1 Tax=Narcine bancroftii TaxID=1343680 RepID=UPI0038317F36